MKAFNLTKFIEKVFSEFEDTGIAKEEIKELLHLAEGYGRDKGISSGKKLHLNRLRFNGTKEGKEYLFDQKFYGGVNIWIADNNKGKSTIFKIITLCLVGGKKINIQSDVKKWIDLIYLEFKIGERVFTSKIDLSKYNTIGNLFTLSIDQLLDETFENKHTHMLWETSSLPDYKQSIENIFYRELDFYSLRYTKKDSSKNSLKLQEVGTSWATYFKSIFLESEDYNSLSFGGQEGKVVQMLFGLSLTYPINRLTIKKQVKENDLAKLKLVTNHKPKEKIKKDINFKENQLKKVEERINYIKKTSQATPKYEAIQKQYDALVKSEQVLVSRRSKFFKEINNQRGEKYSLESKITDHRNEYTQTNRTLTLLIKKKERLEEYIEIGSFFSNLDIMYCPHCDHEITPEEKKKEKEDGSCSLCHHGLNEANRIDPSEFKNKISKYEEDISRLSNQEKNIKQLGIAIKKRIEKVKEQIDKDEKKLIALNQNSQQSQIIELGRELKEYKNSDKKYQAERESLLIQKGSLQQEIKQLTEHLKKSAENEKIPKLETEIKVLIYAIEALKKKRIERSESILALFESTLLSQLHRFGLTYYSEAKINSSFKLYFIKNGEHSSFSDTSPGEQVRIKLAFYLSIIELDISHNYGRHPRFIILDTPGKEEADAKFLKGLKSTLLEIESSYQDELQLFVGTAQRNLEGATSKKKHTIKKAEETLF